VERADREEQEEGARELTLRVLTCANRNALVHHLQPSPLFRAPSQGPQRADRG
jgi:hypothetical protein